MEFWGVEVKSGEPLEVVPGLEMLVHISQASLGEIKKNKGNESFCLYVNTGGQKLVIGTLSAEKFPQISFDLVFEKKFELSHNWKNGSVYFCGYKAPNAVGSESSDTSSGSDSEFDIGLPHDTTVELLGKPQQLKQEKPDTAAAEQKVKVIEPNKDAKATENVDGGDKDDDDESSEDEDILSDRSSSSEDEDDDEDEDDEDDKNQKNKETPKKAGPIKKRPAESIAKTPLPDKKAKFVTPKKNDGKKSDGKKSGGGHVATPYPSKQVGKTTANTEKPKQLVQKSGRSFSCKSCNRSFNSENALESHTKAKHAASK